MKPLWNRWLRLLAIEDTAEPLALCRILCGIGLFLSMWFVLPNGAINVLWVDDDYGGYRDLGSYWTPAVAYSLAGICVLAALALVVGFRARIAAAVGLIAFNIITHINFHDGSAYDALLTNQLFLLVWVNSGATWSVEALRKGGSWWGDERVPMWPRYVMILQLVLCYCATGLQKVTGHWLPGGDLSAVWYVLQDPFWRRFDLDAVLPGKFWATQVATAFSWWFEVLSPLLLLAFWFRATRERGGRLRRLFNRIDYRTVFAIAGIAFHLGIVLFMRVGPFGWIILSYYPALWSAREYRSMALRRRVVRQASEPA